MKYRGLTYNREKESYEWVYGLPSYGYATDEVAEIGTVYGDFKEIFPDTLGEQTPYRVAIPQGKEKRGNLQARTFTKISNSESVKRNY